MSIMLEEGILIDKITIHNLIHLINTYRSQLLIHYWYEI